MSSERCAGLAAAGINLLHLDITVEHPDCFPQPQRDFLLDGLPLLAALLQGRPCISLGLSGQSLSLQDWPLFGTAGTAG